MITVHNYFERSQAEWRALPLTWVEKLFHIRRSNQDVILGNRVWRKNFNSVSSYYWVSEDETHVIRLSDHWTAGSSTINCDWIANCWWTLAKDTGAKSEGVKRTRHRKWRQTAWCAGIVAFKDMRPI